ncbi:MAG: phosphatidylserine decarboxylase [Spirochaetaceae bacterium]|jgi:phosphatidylserine decarboxylase|nr:phosphatidylserine decarboxylase [Spirochaetaceae bacterium]
MSLAKEGLPFIVIPLVLASVLFILNRGFVTLPPAIILIVFSLFCVFFFRDPSIKINADEKFVLSPCNGTVMEVVEGETETVIRVFLSIFNVHLQRAPVRGRVLSVEHIPGSFLVASHPQAYLRNEQNVITIESAHGVFVVRQIAGFLARRCVSYAGAGDEVGQGEKIGLIKFSSQVDLHVPKTVKVVIARGDKVRAGITVFGETR